MARGRLQKSCLTGVILVNFNDYHKIILLSEKLFAYIYNQGPSVIPQTEKHSL